MQYSKTVPGTFLSRPNRFIALCRVEGEEVAAHFPNTGRCAELLAPGAGAILLPAGSSARKTSFTLVSLYKGGALVNIESTAPNRLVREGLESGFLQPFGEPCRLVRPEAPFGGSRFDFYAETSSKQGYIEVKGCTLEENGACFFPDAPTLRGLRHLHELTCLAKQGLSAALLFIVQLEGAQSFQPNRRTQPAFADALRTAAENGVKILAYSCRVSPGEVTLAGQLPVFFT